jgi:hypothetical protein
VRARAPGGKCQLPSSLASQHLRSPTRCFRGYDAPRWDVDDPRMRARTRAPHARAPRRRSTPHLARRARKVAPKPTPFDPPSGRPLEVSPTHPTRAAPCPSPVPTHARASCPRAHAPGPSARPCSKGPSRALRKSPSHPSAALGAPGASPRAPPRAPRKTAQEVSYPSPCQTSQEPPASARAVSIVLAGVERGRNGGPGFATRENMRKVVRSANVGEVSCCWFCVLVKWAKRGPFLR